MTDEELYVTQEGAVATLWLDRPQKRNAVTRAMWAALPGLLDELAASGDVRVVVVRGAGGTFSAGADVSELGEQVAADPDEVTGPSETAGTVAAGAPDAGYAAVNRAAEEALAAFPKPTVALVQGVCVGGGCQIAVACDLRVADTTARFGITPARLGIVYAPGALERLVHLVGPSAAKWLLYTGDLVDVDWALGTGLVDAVHPPDRVEEAVATLAVTLAERSLLTQRATKEMVTSLLRDGAVDEVLARRWASEARDGPDAKEGVAAFLERRPPRFTWR